jgi:hypothetical protein
MSILTCGIQGGKGHKSKSQAIKNVERKREREKGKERITDGVNMFKVYYMHAWKCHNESPLFVWLNSTNKKASHCKMFPLITTIKFKVMKSH